MSFLGLPLGALGALFGAAGAALTVLYLLKLRRRRVVVPYAQLWIHVVGERRSESLWRRLKRLFSLLIQLTVLALLVLALGDPRPAQGGRGRTVAILVDASASMRATDEEPAGTTRIERARRAARELVAGLGTADQATVIRLDARPIALGGLESDVRELERQVDAVEASDTAADLDRGLRLAADVLRGRPRPMLILIGDGAWPREVLDRLRLGEPSKEAQSELAAIDLRGVDVRHVPVGRSGDNVGIVSFSVRRYRQNRSSYEVEVEVQSFRDAPSAVKLELTLDGEVVDVERIALGPRERAQRFLPNLAGAGTRLEARLLAADGEGPHRDALALDDRAYAVLPPRTRQKVLLVSEGNLFLEGALLLNENIALEKLRPAEWDAARAARHDVVILDGYTPPAPPAAAALYLDPRGPESPFRIAGEEPGVLVTEVAEKHPVMRWVTLRDLNVSRTSRFALRPGDVALASSLKQPVIVAREGEHRMIALGFDVRRSDLPLRVAFPLLLVNAFDWLAAEGRGEDASAWRTGRSWRLPARGVEATVTGPGGRAEKLPVAEGHVRHWPERAGFYTLTVERAEGGLERRVLAANLADAAESAIAPARTISVAGKALEAPSGFRRGLRRELWAYLVLAALAISLVEWWTYHRRVTV